MSNTNNRPQTRERYTFQARALRRLIGAFAENVASEQHAAMSSSTRQMEACRTVAERNAANLYRAGISENEFASVLSEIHGAHYPEALAMVRRTKAYWKA